MNRPVPEIDETNEVIRRGNTIENAAFLFGFSRTAQFGSDQIDNATVMATSVSSNIMEAAGPWVMVVD